MNEDDLELNEDKLEEEGCAEDDEPITHLKHGRAPTVWQTSGVGSEAQYEFPPREHSFPVH